MAWRIEFDAGALRDLRRLDRQVARRITLFMRDRIGVLDDPRRFGAPLKHVGVSAMSGRRRRRMAGASHATRPNKQGIGRAARSTLLV